MTMQRRADAPKFSRKTPHQMYLEKIYDKKIEEIIVDVLVKSQGYLGVTAEALSETSGINVSISTLTRWIDKFYMRDEVEKIRAAFGRATSTDLVEAGLFTSERIAKSIDGGLCTSCEKPYEELLQPVKFRSIQKEKGIYTTENSLSIAMYDRSGVGHFFILNKNIIKGMIDEL